MMHQRDIDTSAVETRRIWLLAQIKRRQLGGIPTVTHGGKYESYTDRKGLARWRRMSGTGKRLFVPQVILERAGFDVFLPVEKKLQATSRYQKGHVTVLQPVLFDWLFVGWSADADQYRRLVGLDVVKSIVGVNGCPRVVSEPLVKWMMRRWGGGHLSPELMRYMGKPSPPDVGDTVTIPIGQAATCPMKVTEVSNGRVKGIIEILGKKFEKEFAQDQVVNMPPKM